MDPLLPRSRPLHAVQTLLASYPVVAILGARQVGKTTLAGMVKQASEVPVTWFDLEDPDHAARLAEPGLILRDLRGLVVLDEIQRLPDLFPLLRVLADRRDVPARFLVLGSASPSLLRQSSESLAGRIAFYELDGLALDELGVAHWRRLWLRGGFPPSTLAAGDTASWTWRRNLVRTFVERDLPQLGVRLPAATTSRFWTMLAHYHGQTWNASELGRAFGVSHTTIERYLDTLVGTFAVRRLRPWHANLSKRQVRSPKIYLRDTGLLHTHLGIREDLDLQGHPKVGASWEGFALGEVVQALEADPEDCYFWATHAGAELDLLVHRRGQRLGFEFKRTTTPRRTRSMQIAIEDLGLQSIRVVYPGSERFPLGKRVEAVGIEQVWDLLRR